MKTCVTLAMITSSPLIASSFLTSALGLELPSWKDSSLFRPIGDLKTIIRQQNKRVTTTKETQLRKHKEMCFGKGNLDVYPPPWLQKYSR